MRRSTEQMDAEHALHVGSGPHDNARCACRHDGSRWIVFCKAAEDAYNTLKKSLGTSQKANTLLQEHALRAQRIDEGKDLLA